MPTSIEWTDETWNPVRGCSRVSEGCRHCYAERFAARFRDVGQPYHGLVRTHPSGEPRWTGEVRVVSEALELPLRWRKPRRVFVNSMSDLFHEAIPEGVVDQVFGVMALAQRHTFQILTKRPEAMLAYFRGPERARWVDQAAEGPGHGERPISMGGVPWPLPNVWLGVSVEDQATADARIPLLLQTPAALRFVSAEPLLGPLDLRAWINGWCPRCKGDGWEGYFPTRAELSGRPRDGRRRVCPRCRVTLPEVYEEPVGDEGRMRPALHWLITGGESGPGARPMHPAWARELRDQCVAAGVPFFFKQWGEWAPGESVPDHRRYDSVVRFDDRFEPCADDWAVEQDHGPILYRLGKRKAGRVLEGRTWDEFPEAARA